MGSAENRSGSESAHSSEPPPSRQQRFGSTTSEFMSGNGYGRVNYVDEQTASLTSDNLAQNRARGLSSPSSHELPLPAGARHGWINGHRASVDASNTKLPWAQSSEYRTLPSLASAPNHGGRSSMSSGSASVSRPPSLRTEPSSTGSMSSVSYSLPRTPSDASLPIHALLSSKPEPAYLSQQIPPMHPSPRTSTLGFPVASSCVPIEGHMQGVQPSYTKVLSSGVGDSRGYHARETGLDGISALLQARDIVDRRP